MEKKTHINRNRSPELAMTHRKERALSPHIFPMELCAHPCFSLWAIKTKQKLAVIKTDLFIWKWKPFNRIQPSLHKKAKTYKRGSSLKTKGKRLWRHPLLVGIYCPAGNFCNQLATSENEHICLMELFVLPCFLLRFQFSTWWMGHERASPLPQITAWHASLGLPQ